MKVSSVWLGLFFFTIVSIVLPAALLGALLFPLAGWVFGLEREWTELAIQGAHDLGFLAFLWAPSIALVRVLLRKSKQNKQN